MKPSTALATQREAIRALIGKHRAFNPRVFGSVTRGEDGNASDLDLLVDVLPGTSLFDLGGLQDEIQTMLGIRVDVLTEKDLPVHFRNVVLAGAKAL